MDQFRSLEEQHFVSRDDGDWNYYPRGFAKPGYRVSAAVRQKILAQPFSRLPLVLITISTVIGTWFIHGFENRLIFVAAMALPAGILMGLYRRSKLRVMMAQSPELVSPRPEAEPHGHGA
jgi:hypothetical protein